MATCRSTWAWSRSWYVFLIEKWIVVIEKWILKIISPRVNEKVYIKNQIMKPDYYELE